MDHNRGCARITASRAAVAFVAIGVASLAGCVRQAPGHLSHAGGDMQDQSSWYLKAYRATGHAYLAPQPFEAIDLEVNAVPGAELTEAELCEITAFLRDCSGKPVAVRVALLPADVAAQGVPATVIATRSMEGHGSEMKQPRAACLHMLLLRNTRLPGLGMVSAHYPCGVFIDVGWFSDWRRALLAEAIKHECAHAMGLCHDSPNSDRGHCTNRGCLMEARFGIRVVAGWMRAIVGLPPAGTTKAELCPECRQCLAALAQSERPCSIEWRGAFLVRREHEYFVATLPSHVHLGLGSSSNAPWDTLRQLARAQAGKVPNSVLAYSTTFSRDAAFDSDPRETRRVLQVATSDWDPRVVRLAREAGAAWGVAAGSEQSAETSAIP